MGTRQIPNRNQAAECTLKISVGDSVGKPHPSVLSRRRLSRCLLPSLINPRRIKWSNSAARIKEIWFGEASARSAFAALLLVEKSLKASDKRTTRSPTRPFFPEVAEVKSGAIAAAEGEETCSGIVPMKKRDEVLLITDFGGVGDGRTLNTEAFMSAVDWIEQRNAPGGTLLYIPAGVWLTGAFNLTSRMTLFLAKGAVIKATQDTSSWPLIDPLPSYGRGRELPGGRYMSFIHGNRLQDVIITGGAHAAMPLISTSCLGENGTIDGQGDLWWNMWRQRTLRFTRPNLVELMHSTDIIISNVVFLNSPFWNIHPVYCRVRVGNFRALEGVGHLAMVALSGFPHFIGTVTKRYLRNAEFENLRGSSSITFNVVVRNVTILAPHDSPNTDGVDPDSSLNVCIEDCYISTGDDLVAIKSGWDEYGMAYARQSSGITVRRITGSGPFAGFAIGSETSGGITNVLAENLNIFNSGIGIHIKTNSGRGGFIRNITISDVNLSNVRKGLRIAGNVGGHPDDHYNPNALPVVEGLMIKNVWGVGIQQPGSIQGIKNSPFMQICLLNVKLDVAATRVVPWVCADVSGGALEVQPAACSELTSTNSMNFCTTAL
ncbi:hypothetical protein ZIOFF_063830 [Zingiber officinale]|uniref:Pectin lyase-like superfamily protein n=1 Tax=Zingiber officinale TaxID=94328 RepID=A0A8J5F5L3_ZINOF|nr:hypothetical protein ZIOFF_063830 [Zingiber officinale]